MAGVGVIWDAVKAGANGAKRRLSVNGAVRGGIRSNLNNLEEAVSKMDLPPLQQTAREAHLNNILSDESHILRTGTGKQQQHFLNALNGDSKVKGAMRTVGNYYTGMGADGVKTFGNAATRIGATGAGATVIGGTGHAIFGDHDSH